MTSGRRCSARRTDGQPCKAWPIRGTKVCRVHGGMAPQVREAGRRRLELERFRGPIAELLDEYELDADDVHPVDGLLDAIRRSAAMVQVLGTLVGGLHPTYDPTDLTDDGRRKAALYGPDHLGDARPHVLVTMYGQWVDRHAKACKLALEAGIEERRIRLAEHHALSIVEVITGSLRDLGIDPADPAVRQIVGARLRNVQDRPLVLSGLGGGST